jgi:hypothetical protein
MQGKRSNVVELVAVGVADFAEFNVVIVLFLSEVGFVDFGGFRQFAVRFQVTRLVRIVLQDHVSFGVLEVSQTDQDDVTLTNPNLRSTSSNETS